MKKFILLVLAAVLAACASPVPTEQSVAAPPEPTATPIVVVQTVVVEATQVPTDVPPPTEVPPTAAPVVVTVVVEPTQAAPTQSSVQVSNNSLIALADTLGKGVFTNMTMSSSNVTLRCTPRDITFNVTTPNTAIADVMFFYRIMDLGRLYSKEYKAFGKMTPNGNGNFTLTFSGENIHPDLRIDGSWLDFQFVGLAKSGNVVDRSQTIESQVKYTFDCP